MYPRRYDPDAMLTGTEAAKAVDVSKQLVHWWRTKGHLAAHGSPPRYRYGDVLEAERATRRSPHSHRNED